MNYKMIFKNVALSTLLLSAVAGPTAFANSSPTNAKLERATTAASTHLIDPVKLESGKTTAAFPLIDPVKLAEEYASDTLSEWKATITKYNDILAKRFETISVGEVSVAQPAVPSLTLTEKDLPDNIQVSLKSIPLTKDQLSSIKVIPGELISVSSEISGTIAVDGVTAVNAITELKPSPFFEGLIALDKAAQTKNESTIREALAKQLELYKQEIISLSKAVDNK